jgi:hypothetical protein
MNSKSLSFLRDASTDEEQIGFCEEKYLLGKQKRDICIDAAILANAANPPCHTYLLLLRSYLHFYSFSV